jgi:hypothetical protein
MSHEHARLWRDRAHEALLRAISIRDEELRWQMLRVAVEYDRLAKRAGDAARI